MIWDNTRQGPTFGTIHPRPKSHTHIHFTPWPQLPQHTEISEVKHSAGISPSFVFELLAVQETFTMHMITFERVQ